MDFNTKKYYQADLINANTNVHKSPKDLAVLMDLKHIVSFGYTAHRAASNIAPCKQPAIIPGRMFRCNIYYIVQQQKYIKHTCF